MSIERLICPPGAGVASAIGMLASSISFEIARAAPTALDTLDFDRAAALLAGMDAEASALVAGAGVEEGLVSRRFSAMMRYKGQGYEIEAPVDLEAIRRADGAILLQSFSRAYERRYGRSEEMPVELLSWRLAVTGPRSSLVEALEKRADGDTAAPAPGGRRPVWFDDKFIESPVYDRARLGPGAAIDGPAIVEEVESTLVLPPGFTLSVDGALNLVLASVP
jgi:N-methylhydantoinase A